MLETSILGAVVEFNLTELGTELSGRVSRHSGHSFELDALFLLFVLVVHPSVSAC